MSWRGEVVADASGKWTSNALRFATRAEAEAWVNDLFRRWTLVTDKRVVECAGPVTASWVPEKGLQFVENAQ